MLTSVPGAPVKEAKSGNFKSKRTLFKLLIQCQHNFQYKILPYLTLKPVPQGH